MHIKENPEKMEFGGKKFIPKVIYEVFDFKNNCYRFAFFFLTTLKKKNNQNYIFKRGGHQMNQYLYSLPRILNPRFQTKYSKMDLQISYSTGSAQLSGNILHFSFAKK